jgi:hypothetical protein
MLQLPAARTGWRWSVSGNPSRTNVFQGSAGCGVAIFRRGGSLPATTKIEEKLSPCKRGFQLYLFLRSLLRAR